MLYTKKPMVIDQPSKELVGVVEKLRQHKLAQMEILRQMKPEDLDCRIYL